MVTARPRCIMMSSACSYRASLAASAALACLFSRSTSFQRDTAVARCMCFIRPSACTSRASRRVATCDSQSRHAHSARADAALTMCCAARRWRARPLFAACTPYLTQSPNARAVCAISCRSKARSRSLPSERCRLAQVLHARNARAWVDSCIAEMTLPIFSRRSLSRPMRSCSSAIWVCISTACI